MGRRAAPGRVGLIALALAMCLGLFVLAPLLLWALWWPPAFTVLLVVGLAAIVLLDYLRKRDVSVASTRIGVRGRRFAELVGTTGLPCPRCGYDLAGADSDVCPECGEEMEIVVRTQLHYEVIESQGPGISERDMRGLSAPAVRVLGLAVLLPAIVGPAGIVVHKAASRGLPAVFAGGCLVYMLYLMVQWVRKDFEAELPRQRTEALLSTGLVAALAILISFVELAF